MAEMAINLLCDWADDLDLEVKHLIVDLKDNRATEDAISCIYLFTDIPAQRILRQLTNYKQTFCLAEHFAPLITQPLHRKISINVDYNLYGAGVAIMTLLEWTQWIFLGKIVLLVSIKPQSSDNKKALFAQWSQERIILFLVIIHFSLSFLIRVPKVLGKQISRVFFSEKGTFWSKILSNIKCLPSAVFEHSKVCIFVRLWNTFLE